MSNENAMAILDLMRRNAEANAQANSQHVYTHYDPTPPHVSVKCEKNSKSINWEVSVSGCASVADAMKMLDEARKEMEQRFGTVIAT